MEETLHVTQAHFQNFDLPHGSTLLATGERCPNQAFRYGRHAYGLQFHPEVTHHIFRRWQTAEWAFHDHPGAQTVEEQTRLMELHDAAQASWTIRFLGELFQDTDLGTESEDPDRDALQIPVTGGE
jgi:GMP synthase (glutamine-hydrolysing)